MKRHKPRKQFDFETIETRPELDYVPPKSRDSLRIELFTNKPPGFVIAWQQMIGAQASAEAFNNIAEEGSQADLRELSGVLSVTAIGTAYHTFAVPEQHQLMYRKIRLPRMVESETKERTSQEELVDDVRAGLSRAADLATMIEEIVSERRDPHTLNEKLGRSLATTGFTLAAIHEGISELRDDEAGMQHAAWKAARSAATRSIELSGAMGARPTFAQLADEHSPLRRYMHDHPEFAPEPVHTVLVEEVRRNTNTAYNERFLPYDVTAIY